MSINCPPHRLQMVNARLGHDPLTAKGNGEGDQARFSSKIKTVLVVIIVFVVFVLSKQIVYTSKYITPLTTTTKAIINSSSLPQVDLGNFPNQEVNENKKCLNLDFDENMDAMIGSAIQIFVTMPAKAAGTSLKRFTKNCMNTTQELPDNSLNRADTVKREMLTNSFRLPSIISSHLFNDNPLVDLVKYSTRHSLIIYVHREENERIISAIKHVLRSRLCTGKFIGVTTNGTEFNIASNKTDCIMDEMPVVNIIENKVQEISDGSSEILTCKTYDAIKENAPDMIFMHYKQANQLQKLLAKHHCPELMSAPVETNVAKQKENIQVHLRLQKGGGIVKLDAWLEKKAGLLEYLLKLSKNASCQGKTRNMEDDLFACPDRTIKVSNIRQM